VGVLRPFRSQSILFASQAKKSVDRKRTMGIPVVATHPTRTSAEIAGDRKAATAFFARFDRPWGGRARRDLTRLMERESYDWNLRCCTAEGARWASVHERTPAQRAMRTAARVAADPLSVRDDSQLRPYVSVETTAAMPPNAAIRRNAKERARNWDNQWKWQKKITVPIRRQRILRDAHLPYAQWLLLRPGFGSLRPASVVQPRQPSFTKYVKGQLRPVNMSANRALNIAIAALNNREKR
jgi:hypothetical protein